jgi:hypothetical protein
MKNVSNPMTFFPQGVGSKYGFAGCPSEFRVIVRDKEGGKGNFQHIIIWLHAFCLVDRYLKKFHCHHVMSD